MQKCLERVPKVTECCGCIKDLKLAAAIIAVLGIVSSPMVSWVIVRHMYVVRVSCVVTTSATHPDIVDISMTNALSFGFGVSSALGSSCLTRKTTQNGTNSTSGDKSNSNFIKFVRGSGWIVLIADLVFVVSCVNFLINLSQGADKSSIYIFILTGFISIVLSFVYGMLYLSACVYMGGLFPVFEFFFACFDLITWVTWLYFIVVMNTYNVSSRVIPDRQTDSNFILALLFNGGEFLQKNCASVEDI